MVPYHTMVIRIPTIRNVRALPWAKSRSRFFALCTPKKDASMLPIICRNDGALAVWSAGSEGLRVFDGLMRRTPGAVVREAFQNATRVYPIIGAEAEE